VAGHGDPSATRTSRDAARGAVSTVGWCLSESNEVGSSHPLMRTLAAIRKAKITVREIILAPLELDDFLANSSPTRCTASGNGLSLWPRLCTRRPAAIHSLRTSFSALWPRKDSSGSIRGWAAWNWDLERIRAKGHTDNIVDLMIGKLNRLSAVTREVLKRLACLGNDAEAATLSLVHEASEDEIHSALWDAVRAGVVFRWDDAYAFPHDRIQEAAYALVSEAERAAVHLRIGRLLARHTSDEKLEEMIFEIVNQLNRSVALFTTIEEREQVAELNLIAGDRARLAIAYDSSLVYLATGEALLSEDCWERCYALAFAMQLKRAECEFLTGELATAEERLSTLSARSATRLAESTRDVHC